MQTIEPARHPANQSRSPRRRFRGANEQRRLFCSCGTAAPAIAGLCRRCYWRRSHSRRKFSGFREAVLERDGNQCRACGNQDNIAVHHRRRVADSCEELITLCAGCHARVHKLLTLRVWVPEVLIKLWIEQHPGAPIQLQFTVSAVVTV